MSRPKNLTQIDDKTCKILCYGVIDPETECSAASFVGQLDYAAQFYTHCFFHINSPGGDVYEALAIRQTLKKSPMNITIVIDGIAASAASLIMLSGIPFKIGKYSRVMLHRASGSICGNADEIAKYARETQAVEDDLVTIIALATGMAVSDCKTKFFDGKDHWLTADDCVAMNLCKPEDIIDGVMPENPILTNDIAKVYNSFKNVLIQNDETMKWENFFKKANLKNDASEQDAIDNYNALEKRATDAEAKAKDLEDENKTLKDELDAKKKADTEKEEAEILEAVENAVKDGRVQAAHKDHYVAILKADKKNGMAIINALPKAKRIMDNIKNEEPDGTEKWSFRDWQAKDGKGLAKMKEEEPERFKALYKKAFNKDFQEN